MVFFIFIIFLFSKLLKNTLSRDYIIFSKDYIIV